MTTVRVTDAAVDDLRIVNFFDPAAAFNYGTSTEVSLVSQDGYELVFEGEDFAFNSRDEPTDGVITDVYLYDPSGDLVGRIDGVNYSLEDYYDKVAVDGRSGAFTAELMAGGDDIAGGAADDHLEGYEGKDTIEGNGGDDLISGGSGSDVLRGGTGADILYGGDGNDRLSGDSGDDSIAGDAGADTIYGGAGADKLEGGSEADQIFGEADRDVIGGGSGSDRLDGGTGADKLYGDSGKDALIGGTGDDSLSGGSGDDRLFGGANNDVLIGGSGDDQFNFAKLGDGVDVVRDFTRGDDKLVFDASGFTGMSADFGLVVGEDPMATSAKGTFLFDTDSHKLFWDANGSGKGGVDLVAVLDDVTHLSKNDFIIT